MSSVILKWLQASEAAFEYHISHGNEALWMQAQENLSHMLTRVVNRIQCLVLWLLRSIVHYGDCGENSTSVPLIGQHSSNPSPDTHCNFTCSWVQFAYVIFFEPNFNRSKFKHDNCLVYNYSCRKPLSILLHKYIVVIVLPVVTLWLCFCLCYYVPHVETFFFLKEFIQPPALTQTKAGSYQCHAN